MAPLEGPLRQASTRGLCGKREHGRVVITHRALPEGLIRLLKTAGTRPPPHPPPRAPPHPPRPPASRR